MTRTACTSPCCGWAANGDRSRGTSAFALVAERLAGIQARYGQNAVAVYQGNPSVHNYGLMTHSNYFLGLLKTRNRFSATSVDQLPHHLTSHLMYGHGLLLPIPDIDHTDFMLILGGNPLASNGSIMTVPDVEKRLKAIQARGGKVVVVDPRRSETAAIADQHLFVRPGGDAALLFGVLNTLFAENLTRASHLPVDGLDDVRRAIAGVYRRGHEPPVRGACRADPPVGAGLCRGGQGRVLRAHGRLDPGVRHAVPLAGAIDQPGHR